MSSARAIARFGEVLVKATVIDPEQLTSALAHLEQWGGRLPKVIAELGFADEDIVTEHLAKALRVPLVHLGHGTKDMQALRALDAAYCEQRAIFPISLKERVLTLAMADPTELDVVDEVQQRTNARVVPQMASESEILNAIRKHYRGQQVRVTSNRALKAVKRLDELSREDGGDGERLELDRRPPPAPPSSGGSLLAQLMGERPDFTPEDLARLEVARVNQGKLSTILKVVTELLAEKGLRR